MVALTEGERNRREPTFATAHTSEPDWIRRVDRVFEVMVAEVVPSIPRPGYDGGSTPYDFLKSDYFDFRNAERQGQWRVLGSIAKFADLPRRAVVRITENSGTVYRLQIIAKDSTSEHMIVIGRVTRDRERSRFMAGAIDYRDLPQEGSGLRFIEYVRAYSVKKIAAVRYASQSGFQSLVSNIIKVARLEAVIREAIEHELQPDEVETARLLKVRRQLKVLKGKLLMPFNSPNAIRSIEVLVTK